MGMGQYIKSLAKEKGITLQQLAEAANVSPNTVYGIIRRDSETVSSKIAAKLAPALDIPVHYLTQDIENQKLAADLMSAMAYSELTIADLSHFTHISKERLQRMLSGQTKISPKDHELIEYCIKKSKERVQMEGKTSEALSVTGTGAVRIIIDYDPNEGKATVRVIPNQADGEELHESYQGFKKEYERMQNIQKKGEHHEPVFLQN